MIPNAQEAEYPYSVKLEISDGQAISMQIVFLTRSQVENLLQCDFMRLVQEASIKGARIHVERLTTPDYEEALSELAASLAAATPKAA